MKIINIIIIIFYFLTFSISTMTIDVQAKEYNEIDAKIILNKIEKGEDINLENVSIRGEFNLNGLALNKTISEQSACGMKGLKIVESNITITDSIFENKVDLSFTHFNKTLNFQDTYFLKNVFFSNVILNDVSFTYTNFARETHFECTSFSGNYTYFNRVKFEDVVLFSNANFNHYVKFNASKFYGDFTLFDNVTFNDSVPFEYATFNNKADFTKTNFNRPVTFYYTKFYKVLFMDTNFRNETNFEYAIFDNLARFDNANFSNPVTFNYTKFNTVSFDNTTFKKINLKNTEYDKIININWSYFKSVLEYNGETYIRLIRNFRELEQFRDADYAYLKYKQMRELNSIPDLLREILEILSGYGVLWHGILVNIIFVLILFSIFYDRIGLHFPDCLECSAIALFSGYSNDFIEDKIPRGRYSRTTFKLLMIFESLIGWLLLGILIVVLSNIIMRI